MPSIPYFSFHSVETPISPYLNHFIQPDTIIPDPSNPQAWNRYSYTRNNPINNVDPSGHDDIPWWEITKFLGRQLFTNGIITDTDWRDAANIYIPAKYEGSNAAALISIAETPLAGGGEINLITHKNGEIQLYSSYGAGAGLGTGVAVGVTQGGIVGRGFKSTTDFEGLAWQGAAGANLPIVYLGGTFDVWAAVKTKGGLSHVYGVDAGITVGTPGASLSLTNQKAAPITKNYTLSGFGLFVCRVANQCGRSIVKQNGKSIIRPK